MTRINDGSEVVRVNGEVWNNLSSSLFFLFFPSLFFIFLLKSFPFSFFNTKIKKKGNNHIQCFKEKKIQGEVEKEGI